MVRTEALINKSCAPRSRRTSISSSTPPPQLTVSDSSFSTLTLHPHVAHPSLPAAPTEQEWRDPTLAIALLELRAANAMVVNEHAQHSVAGGESDASANQRVSRAVTEAFVAAQVGEIIRALDKLPEKDRAIVTKVFLLRLDGLALIRHHPSKFLELDDKMNDPTRSVSLAIKDLCEELLPEAIGLTDAFGFMDWDLERVGWL